MGRLTTHVLDVAAGVPAQGMRVELHRGSPSIRIASATTDGDGRCPQALLEGDALQRGEYELSFYAGDYFRARAVHLPDPPFLDIVVIRFGIADAAAHYHVPLLVSPWSYSTYRGS